MPLTSPGITPQEPANRVHHEPDKGWNSASDFYLVTNLLPPSVTPRPRPHNAPRHPTRVTSPDFTVHQGGDVE